MTPRAEHVWALSEREKTWRKYIGGLEVRTKKGVYTIPEHTNLIIPVSLFWAEGRTWYEESVLRDHLHMSEVMELGHCSIRVTKKEKTMTSVTVNDVATARLLEMFFQTHGNRMRLRSDGTRLQIKRDDKNFVKELLISGKVEFTTRNRK